MVYVTSEIICLSKVIGDHPGKDHTTSLEVKRSDKVYVLLWIVKKKAVASTGLTGSSLELESWNTGTQ